MSPRRYISLTLIATLALVAGIHGLAWWLQPVYGDLTRIGGYAERDFGWNEPMHEFHPLLISFGEWAHPVDVLVIGDSFANLRPHQQWQNWLAARTGWRIHTLDKHLVNIDQLTTSDLFRKHPPRVVIWNNIERDLQAEYSAPEETCELPTSRVKDPLKIDVSDPIPQPRAVQRSQKLAELNAGFARLWILKSSQRLIGTNTSEALRSHLVRSDLFSNRLSGDILVYRKDFVRNTWTQADLNRIRCGYVKLAKQFEANGVTRFMTALAPDKSSAYHPWLANPDTVPESRLTELLNEFAVPDARLDHALVKAISLGMRDAYMPNDTHWGAAGHRLAAEAILNMLTAEGLTR